MLDNVDKQMQSSSFNRFEIIAAVGITLSISILVGIVYTVTVMRCQHAKAKKGQQNNPQGDVHMLHQQTSCEDSVPIDYNPAYTAMEQHQNGNPPIIQLNNDRNTGVQECMYESLNSHLTGSTLYYDYISTTERV